MRCFKLLVAGLFTIQACTRAEERTRSNGIIHLPSGDSVEMVAIGEAVVPDRPPGLLITYHAFFPPEDTVRVQRVAAELWRARVKWQLSSPAPGFVVLQATSRRAGPTKQLERATTYGIVLERGEDGKWYYFGSSRVAE